MPRLQPVAEDLWVVQYPLALNGIKLGRQSVVVRLPENGGLILISPGPPEDEVQHELARLGPVRALVVPTCLHDTFLAENLREYMAATLFGTKGVEKLAAVDRRVHTLAAPFPEDWHSLFDAQLIAGMPKVNEVVLLHRPSRTLIVSDLVFNISPHVDWWTRFMLTVTGAYGGVRASRLYRSLIRDRAAQRASLEAVLRWDFDRLIPSHGLVVESGARSAVRRAWKL